MGLIHYMAGVAGFEYLFIIGVFTGFSIPFNIYFSYFSILFMPEIMPRQ